MSPRRLLRIAAGTILAAMMLSVAGCAGRTPPPPLRVEVRPARPHARAVWVPGHWKWVNRKVGYRWVPGHWRLP